MNKLAFAVLLFCSSTVAGAQQLSEQIAAFIKAEDPNALEYWYEQSPDCPWTDREAKNVIEGVIKRSRIKTAEGLGGPNRFNLDVKIRCMIISTGASGYVVDRRVMFGASPYLFANNYGAIAVGARSDKQYFLGLLKEDIEIAVTEFVEVNFLSQ